MIINEIFYSIQGEGLLAGRPCVFIRLAGCPLRCAWCDTGYALDLSSGQELSIPLIIDRIKQWDCKFVVITGGEPMTNPQLPVLAGAIKELGRHITIETAGTIFINGIACDLMSISPKTSNSGMESALNPKVINRLVTDYQYQLKFVVESESDLPEIQQVIESLRCDIDPARIMLMPQAKTRRELIDRSPVVADLCKKTGYTFCSRLQILLYDGQAGK